MGFRNWALTYTPLNYFSVETAPLIYIVCKMYLFKVSSGFFLACVAGGTRTDRQTLSKGWFSDMNMNFKNENIYFYFTAGKHGKLLHSST